MFFADSLIPLDFHAFPDVVPEPDLLQLKTDEIRHLIKYHQDAILASEEKINWHQKAIAQYHGCLNVVESPINRLMPPEILREIFSQLMWSCVSGRVFPSFSPIDDKEPRISWLKVAFVCRHWRSIAISYPVLFSCINIRICEGGDDFKQRELEYSQPNPLHILSCDLTPNEMQTLVPHVSRIRTMNLRQLTFSRFDDYPTFESIHFLRFHHSYEEPLRYFNGLLDHCPNLQHLQITMDPENAIIFPDVHLPRLTHLCLQGGFFPRPFIRVMEFLPKLEVLELIPIAIPRTNKPLLLGKPLRKLILWAGACEEFPHIVKSIRPDPEVVQMKLQLLPYHLSPSENPDWMRDVIHARPNGTLTLSFEGEYLQIESISPRDGSRISPGTGAEAHQSFDIKELRIGDVSPLTAYEMDKQPPHLLHILSSLHVQTIRWIMPKNLSIPNDPLADGYDRLERLFITGEAFGQEQLEVVKRILGARIRKGRPILKVLCLEHRGGQDLEGGGCGGIVTKLKEMVEELRMIGIGAP